MAHATEIEQRPCLDAEQKIDAMQVLGCGLWVTLVAEPFGLSETTHRHELGLQIWTTEPIVSAESLFDSVGGES